MFAPRPHRQSFPTPVDVSYSLLITKTSGTGSAALTRAGESRRAGGEDRPLATLRQSVDSSDACNATRVLHVNGEHVEYSVNCNSLRASN